jgi:hypothetical protein
MKKVAQLPRLLREMEDQMGGVFTQRDLAHLMSMPIGRSLQARLAGLVEHGYLFRAQRGVYHTENARLEVLATRLGGEVSYLSLSAAMAHRGLVGTRPDGLVDVLAPEGRPRTLSTALGYIRIHVQRPELHFGFERSDGVAWALPEKAWIDSCYFHMRGLSLPFRLREDVALDLLDRERILENLSLYRNPKFIQFVRNLLEED